MHPTIRLLRNCTLIAVAGVTAAATTSSAAPFWWKPRPAPAPEEDPALDAPSSREEWLRAGEAEIKKAMRMRPVRGYARNVILFVADGMGVSTVTAARILEAQLRGEPGEENELFFEKFPHLALAKTYNTNSQVPDSAGTMTAIVCGAKTDIGVLGVDQDVERGDYTTVYGNELTSLLELCEIAGLSTGVVSTARITHATPAACYAKSPDRNWEDDSKLPEEAKAAGFMDIADQLVHFPFGDGIEVALGGGRRHFLPNTMQDPEDEGAFGRRTDGRDLTREWEEQGWRARYVWNKAQFDAINPRRVRKLLGLFERSHMEYEYDRPTDAGGEPSLTEMTQKAIKILDRNPRGYFLMVESGRVDHAHHATNAYRALTDTIEFARAVKKAYEMTDPRETLIVVTADHSHVFTIAGYPEKGTDILGFDPLRQLDSNGNPYTTLGYANGPGYRGPGPRPLLTLDEVTDPNYLQETAVPLGSETHAGEDVAIYASGPYAHHFHNTIEQSVIFHIMRDAMKIPYFDLWMTDLR